MSPVEEQIIRLEETAKKVKETAEHRGIDWTFEKVFESNDIHIYKETKSFNGDLMISIHTSLHWTDAATMRYGNHNFDGNKCWDLSYGSGGTVDAPVGDIAEAMKAVFAVAETVLKTQPQS